MPLIQAGASRCLRLDGAFCGGLPEVAGTRSPGREGIREQVLPFGLRLSR